MLKISMSAVAGNLLRALIARAEVPQDPVRLGGDGGKGGGVHLTGTGNGPLDHVLGHPCRLLGRGAVAWLLR